MNWRSPLAIAGALLLTWSIIEWLYFGLIRPDIGACTGDQLHIGDTCYNTWYYGFIGIVIGLSMLIPALIKAPKGTGFEATLWTMGSLFLGPFIAAMVYLNLSVSTGDQYVLQSGDIQYRIAFILEAVAAVGLILFITSYSTYRYMRSAMEQLIPMEDPKQIEWLEDEPVAWTAADEQWPADKEAEPWAGEASEE